MNFFDLHCDTLSECLEYNESLAQNNLGVSLKAKKTLENWAQVFAVWIPEKQRGDDAWAFYQHALSFFKRELEEHGDSLMQVFCGEELDRAFNENKCAGILAVENASVLGGDLRRLEQLAHDGVKILTLTWNGENEAAFGVDIPAESWRLSRKKTPLCKPSGGIKPFGRQLLKELHNLNIAADISHLNARGFWEVIESDKASIPPILASHSNCRDVYYHPRALSDAQILAMIEHGAPIGLTFAYLRKRQGMGPFAVRRDFLAIHKNLKHALELGAQDIICIGSDFDGYAAPKGLENTSKLPDLKGYLELRGHTQYVLNRLFFDNAYNWFKQQL